VIAFGETITIVNEAGFEVAEGMIAVSSCETDVECIESGDQLTDAYSTYLPILKNQIDKLENLEAPDV